LENFNRIVADAGETGIDAKILRPTERSKSEYVRKKTSSRYDLWFLRMSGSGLGNCFYNHYQAVALAERCNARVIVPPWFSVKIGPMLRGQSGKRFYLGMFKPYRGDIGGLRKLWILLSRYWRRNMVEVDGSRPRNFARAIRKCRF
jgi:hypothetical protein